MPGTILNVAAKSVAGPESGLARATDRLPHLETNVGSVERLLSLGIGSALVANGALGKHLSVLSLVTGGYLLYRAASGNCPGYQLLGVGGPQGLNAAIPATHGVKVEHAVTVNAPVDEVYKFWRDFSRLPQFMDHVKSVEVKDSTHSRWTAKGPLGTSVQWDAEIVTDTPNKVIAWRSLPGSDVDTAGSVRFEMAPGGRGTEIHVSLKFDPPGGKLASFVARLFGENPEQTVRGDLMRFKSIVETGEIADIAGQPHGRRA